VLLSWAYVNFQEFKLSLLHAGVHNGTMYQVISFLSDGQEYAKQLVTFSSKLLEFWNFCEALAKEFHFGFEIPRAFF